MIFGAIGGGLAMYYIGAYIKIGKPQLHPATTLSSGGISAMAFFYLVSTQGSTCALCLIYLAFTVDYLLLS